MEKKRRTTTYVLSEDGRDGLEKACRYFCSAFGEILRQYDQKNSR